MKKTYVHAIDVIRIVAILMVIVIHTSSKTLGVGNNDLLGMPLTFWFNQITRGAVAIFIMISGFVLEYGYNGNALDFYKKRASRILTPYIFWSAIYYFFVYAPNPNNFFLILLIGGAAYQLYFIPSLLLFYLAFPWIRKITSVKWLVLLSIVQLGWLYWDYSIKSLQSWGPISIVLMNYLVFILGIMAARYQDKILKIVQKNSIYFVLMSVISGSYVWLEGLGGYLNTNDYLAFYSQRRISILIYTIFLTATLFYFFGKSFFTKTIFKTLSGLSFFVFFVHIIFLELIWTNSEIIHRPEYGLTLFILVTSLSFGSAWLVHRSRFLAKICG